MTVLLALGRCGGNCVRELQDAIDGISAEVGVPTSLADTG